MFNQAKKKKKKAKRSSLSYKRITDIVDIDINIVRLDYILNNYHSLHFKHLLNAVSSKFYLLDYVAKNPIQRIREDESSKERFKIVWHALLSADEPHSEGQRDIHTHGHSHCADPASLSLIISHKCITAAVETLKQANYGARTFTLGACIEPQQQLQAWFFSSCDTSRICGLQICRADFNSCSHVWKTFLVSFLPSAVTNYCRDSIVKCTAKRLCIKWSQFQPPVGSLALLEAHFRGYNEQFCYNSEDQI